MEKERESAPEASQAIECIAAAEEWSARELENAPSHEVDWAKRATIGLTDHQMQSAAMIVGVIILIFGGIGVALSEFTTTEPQTAIVNCLHVAEDNDRLACYDNAATRLSAPFKGGSPFSNFSRQDVEDAG